MDAYIHETLQNGDTFVVAFSGCNFRCRCCNVSQLIDFKTSDMRQTREVASAIDASDAKRILFTGGEPLLQRLALLELLRHCRSHGRSTILDTNGSKPEVIAELLRESLVDEYWIDVKATAAGFAKVARSGTFFHSDDLVFADIEKTLRLLREAKSARTTIARVVIKTIVIPGLLFRKEDILELARLIEPIGAEWLLAPFDPEHAMEPALRGVSSPTQRFLENLAGFVAREHPALRVRVVEHAPPGQPNSSW